MMLADATAIADAIDGVAFTILVCFMFSSVAMMFYLAKEIYVATYVLGAGALISLYFLYLIVTS